MNDLFTELGIVEDMLVRNINQMKGHYSKQHIESEIIDNAGTLLHAVGTALVFNGEFVSYDVEIHGAVDDHIRAKFMGDDRAIKYSVTLDLFIGNSDEDIANAYNRAMKGI
jgi:hypothetical protein